jgi:hypothetical protein
MATIVTNDGMMGGTEAQYDCIEAFGFTEASPAGSGCAFACNQVIVTASPPVSPSVVARILITQKPSERRPRH